MGYDSIFKAMNEQRRISNGGEPGTHDTEDCFLTAKTRVAECEQEYSNLSMVDKNKPIFRHQPFGINTLPNEISEDLGVPFCTPPIFVNHQTWASTFSSLSVEEQRKLYKSVKKDCQCYIDTSSGVVKVDAKYKIDRYQAVISVDGKIYRISEDNSSIKTKVVCGELEGTGKSILLIKITDSNDECDIIIHPEMFIAKVDVLEDKKIPGDTLTANFSYFSAYNKLSCNVALEIPDSNATNYLFEAFSALLLYTGKTMIDNRKEEE